MINDIRRDYERAQDDLESEIECQRISRYMGRAWREHAANIARLRRELSGLRYRASLAGVDLDEPTLAEVSQAYADELSDA